MVRPDPTVARRLEHEIRKDGTQLAFAIRIGVSQAHISEVKNGNADPSDALLKALDLERVVSYRRTPAMREA